MIRWQPDQELLKEVLEDWVEREGARLCDGDVHEQEGPDMVRARAERLNQLVRLSNQDWLQLDIDPSTAFSDDDIEAMVEGTF